MPLSSFPSPDPHVLPLLLLSLPFSLAKPCTSTRSSPRGGSGASTPSTSGGAFADPLFCKHVWRLIVSPLPPASSSASSWPRLFSQSCAATARSRPTTRPPTVSLASSRPTASELPPLQEFFPTKLSAMNSFACPHYALDKGSSKMSSSSNTKTVFFALAAVVLNKGRRGV